MDCPLCGQEAPEVKGVQMDPDSGHMIIDGVALRFTPQEFQVLELLIARFPRVVCKGPIMDYVYGLEGGDEPNDNIVPIHIMRIRRKLNKTNHTIKNEWGLGWRFIKKGQVYG